MYFPLRLVLKALELTYRTPPAQQILQPFILLWTEQRAAQIPLRCLLHGLICTWNKPFKNETRRERKKERDPGREWEISSELPVTRLNSEHWVSLPSSYSQHQQTKGFSRKWTTTLFFFSIFILSACCQRDTLLYVHVAFIWAEVPIEPPLSLQSDHQNSH